MLESLDAPAVRQWCVAGLDALRRHQSEIDALNVFPVPDGDTGTNLVLTVASAAEALDVDTGGGEIDGRAPDGEHTLGGDSSGVTSGGVASADEASAAVTSSDVASVDEGRVDEVEHELGELGRTLRRLARGALHGARGNSGMILAELLGGIADSLAPAPVQTLHRMLLWCAC